MQPYYFDYNVPQDNDLLEKNDLYLHCKAEPWIGMPGINLTLTDNPFARIMRVKDLIRAYNECLKIANAHFAEPQPVLTEAHAVQLTSLS